MELEAHKEEITKVWKRKRKMIRGRLLAFQPCCGFGFFSFFLELE